MREAEGDALKTIEHAAHYQMCDGDRALIGVAYKVGKIECLESAVGALAGMEKDKGAGRVERAPQRLEGLVAQAAFVPGSAWHGETALEAGIVRAHLEEDTAKLFHLDDGTAALTCLIFPEPEATSASIVATAGDVQIETLRIGRLD